MRLCTGNYAPYTSARIWRKESSSRQNSCAGMMCCEATIRPLLTPLTPTMATNWRWAADTRREHRTRGVQRRARGCRAATSDSQNVQKNQFGLSAPPLPSLGLDILPVGFCPDDVPVPDALRISMRRVERFLRFFVLRSSGLSLLIGSQGATAFATSKLRSV